MEGNIHVQVGVDKVPVQSDDSKIGTEGEDNSEEHRGAVATSKGEPVFEKQEENEYDDDDYEEILDHFSEEEDETEFDIKFRKKTVEVVPAEVIFDYRTETVATSSEPIKGIEAHFRSHKHVYPQDGKTYILTHGFYE